MVYQMRFSPEVQRAKSECRPIVALESTIISHGMPYPANVECASEVEQIIRNGGATPATIGIINGEICIGMTEAQLDHFGRLGHKCAKVSRRDVANIISKKTNGATTVSATMLLASMAGIPIFVTGGIGGVHRGAEDTWDVSCDLTELGQTPVSVVCAGAKSILDIPKTLEYLETQGVPVIAMGQDNFPAFFTPDSGLPASARCDSPESVARCISTQLGLGLKQGVVVANPIPADQAAEAELVETATRQAVEEARLKGIGGRNVTPFLLDRIKQLTSGSSLVANVNLVKHNAVIGAQIAVCLNTILKRERPTNKCPAHPTCPSTSFTSSTCPVPTSCPARSVNASSITPRPRLAVVGSVAMDVVSRPSDPKHRGMSRTSSPGTIDLIPGGVGRNLVEIVSRLSNDSQPLMLSAVAKDAFAQSVLEHLLSLGCDVSGVMHMEETGVTSRTATYNALLDGLGELVDSVADMKLIETIPAHELCHIIQKAAKCNVRPLKGVLVDANLSAETLTEVSRAAKEVSGLPVFIETVSVAKSIRCLGALEHATVITPNVDELIALSQELLSRSGVKSGSLIERLNGFRSRYNSGKHSMTEVQDEVVHLSQVMIELGGIESVLTTCGPMGCCLVSSKQLPTRFDGHSHQFMIALPAPLNSTLGDAIEFKIQRLSSKALFYSSAKKDNVVNVTGAGDSLLGTVAWAVMECGCPMDLAVMAGIVAAQMSLFSSKAIHPHINSQSFQHIITMLCEQFNVQPPQFTQQLSGKSHASKM